MERAALLAETLVVQLVVGWPVFLLASLTLGIFLRVRWRFRWLTVFGALGVAFSFSVLVAVVFWRFWPVSLSGPMLGFFHLPALCASGLVFPGAAWCFRLVSRPNKCSSTTLGERMDVRDHPVSVQSLLEGANSYFSALDALATNPKDSFLDPMGLLASQAIELALKAYLLHAGWTERQLRTVVGHDLRTAWQKATNKGLRIHCEHRFSVDVLALSHDSPYLFRYPRERVGAAITEPQVLCRDVKAVITSVEKYVSS